MARLNDKFDMQRLKDYLWRLGVGLVQAAVAFAFINSPHDVASLLLLPEPNHVVIAQLFGWMFAVSSACLILSSAIKFGQRTSSDYSGGL